MKNTNYNRFTFTLILMLILQIAKSQENYISGYIIDNKKDTIRGYIDYREWFINPNKIFFKIGQSEISAKYTPIDIKGFAVSDEVYVSAIVKTEISSSKAEYLDNKAQLNFRTDTIFLQTVITGLKSLFYYKNSSLNDQLYIKDSTYELLIYKQYLKQDELGHNRVQENNTYKGQLMYYFKDSPVLKSKIGNIKYDKRSVEKLFLKYYEETKFGISFHKKTEKTKLEYGFLAGLSLTNFAYAKANRTILPVDGTSKNFTFSVFANFIFPRNQGKWSLCNELNYSRYDGTDVLNAQQTAIGYSILKYNILGRYTYPLKALGMYANIGFSYGRVFKDDINYNAFDYIKKYEIGPLIGMGVKYRRYLIDFRYKFDAGYSDYNTLMYYTDTYYFLLGYRF